MDNKTVIAIVLSMMVLISFQYFYSKEIKPPQTAPSPAANTAASGTAANAVKAAPGVPVPATPSTVPEKIITVSTGDYTATFTTLGGLPTSWVLKKYESEKGHKNKNVNILAEPGTPPALAIGWGGNYQGGMLNFSTSQGNITLNKNNNTGTLVFEYSSGGISIRRTYTFHDGSYIVGLRDEVSGLPDYQITMGPDFGIYSRTEKGVHTGPVLLSDSRTMEINPKKLEGVVSYSGNIKWIAQEDKYFCAALVPVSKMDAARAWAEKGAALISFQAKSPSVEEFKLYAGPKETSYLEKAGAGLQYIVDFGFFSVISRPIFWFLKQIHSVVGNYGWAIIILTIVIRIPFIPLVMKGQTSMRKFQAIQPALQEIRQKYKKDPQRMQKEMMELYKKHKVNPMGGCLPMLLQIPVFFALYKVLLLAIELRGAPWAFWITDLSHKDPYYVLPIIMGITMLVQQKMTPTMGDPKQQKMMMLMPVIFTVMFLNFASGLVLYWLVNNLLSIAQQAYVNKKFKAATSA
ncbi:MAG: membrane protein insertase YidC [Nitrospiraceae bacterium]|nr:membrane protein insertase YidC [Nitrospiraceae bacterium]